MKYALFTVFALALGLTACGGNEPAPQNAAGKEHCDHCKQGEACEHCKDGKPCDCKHGEHGEHGKAGEPGGHHEEMKGPVGDFHAVLPAGTYVVVARSADGMAISTPERITITAGGYIRIVKSNGDVLSIGLNSGAATIGTCATTASTMAPPMRTPWAAGARLPAPPSSLGSLRPRAPSGSTSAAAGAAGADSPGTARAVSPALSVPQPVLSVPGPQAEGAATAKPVSGAASTGTQESAK